MIMILKSYNLVKKKNADKLLLHQQIIIVYLYQNTLIWNEINLKRIKKSELNGSEIMIY